jgi:hypothetical protein
VLEGTSIGFPRQVRRCDYFSTNAPLEHVLPGTPMRGAAVNRGYRQRAEVGQHLRAAADHRAVVRGVERCKAEVLHHPPLSISSVRRPR